MKAIRVHRHGGADVLACEDIDIGEPAPGEVRVRNWAIGVNFVDTYLRSSVFPPPRMALYQHSITMPRQPHSKACCL
jgi:NADPH2:quinone reductase